MKQKYKVIFIIRSTNELDQMLPLICKFVETDHYVRVMTLKLDKLDNYLTSYMFSKCGLLVETPVLDNVNKISKFLIFIFEKMIQIAVNNGWHLPLKYLEYFFHNIKKRYILKHEDSKENPCNTIFDCDNTNVIIVDKTNIIQNKIYKNVAKYAAIKGIPIIRLPHALHMTITNTDSVDGSNILVHDYGDKVFDIYYGMEEIYQKDFACREEGCGKKTNKNKIKPFLLGNMRYSQEWVGKYKEIQQFDKAPDPNIDVKKQTIVVIMSATPLIYLDKVASLLNAIADRFDVNIIYKPHTRRGIVDHKMKGLLNKNNKVIFSYKNTGTLMDMSDIALVCGNSSVAFHSIVSSQPIIFAEYVNKNPTYYSVYMKGCVAVSKYEVLAGIEGILNNNMGYNKDSIAKEIVKEFINPKDSNDVIQDHFNLVSSIVEKSKFN
jgi:hypothetical protein